MDEAGESATEGGSDDGGSEDSLGPGPVRRLTQTQYRYSVLDLLELDALTEAEALQLSVITDGVTGPFRTSGGLVDEEVARSYLALGEQLAARAVQSGAPSRWSCDLAERDCLADYVVALGRRAFRVPFSAADAEPFLALFDEIDAAQGPTRALEVVIATMLSSPRFLYRLEPLDPADVDGSLVPLEDHALAARLSYFLWSSVPDVELLDAAAAGQLSAPEEYEAQVSRMLDDPRTDRTIIEFAADWLALSRLSAIAPNDAAWNDALAASMAAESPAFMRHVMREDDGRFETLLTAAFTVGDDALAELYGASAPDATGRIALDPSERAGLLTHAGLLAQFGQSHPQLFRGLFVRDALLCDRPPPPPANVDPTADRLHTEPCATCHTLFEPIGLGFADYDALGRFSPGNGATEGERADAAVPASGTVDEPELVGPFADVRELGERLASSNAAKTCFVRQWMRYTNGRNETVEDLGARTRLVEAFEDADGDIRELLFAFATSAEFRARSVSDLTEEETQ